MGDGTSIWIWFDLWLPSDFLPYISSLAASEFEEAQVVSLIDPTTNEWNLATLLELFLPRDIALIKSIPLSCKSMEDKLYWPFTPLGTYSVKSGYRFLYKSQCFDNHEYQPKDKALWKKVWGLQVQPKVQNLLWRAIKNSIPTEVNLKHRNGYYCWLLQSLQMCIGRCGSRTLVLPFPLTGMDSWSLLEF